jgi:O-antigen ligase
VRDDRYSLLPAILVWVLVVLMIVPEGFDYQHLTDAGAPAAGSLGSRLLWSGLLFAGAALVVQRARLAWVVLGQINPWLSAFFVLALASVAWSIDPGLSARRLVRVATILLVSLAFVLRGWHEQRLQNVLRPLLTCVMAGSLIFGLAWPELAIHQELSAELAGAWRGLTNHKNGLGALACISLLLWWHAGLTRQVSVLGALTGGLIAAACLVLSRSSTALATSLFVMLFVLIAVHGPLVLRRQTSVLAVGLLLLIGLYALAILDIVPGMATLIAPITALSSKDATLSGRTEIWAVLTDHIQHHPWLGTGYGAYWTAGPVLGTDAWDMVKRLNGFFPGSAHNGYLEVANDLGLVGLVMLLAYIAVQARQMSTLRRTEPEQAALYFALLLQQAITNLSETHWLSVLSLDFLLMTLVTTGLARGLLEVRMRATYAASAETLESVGTEA